MTGFGCSILVRVRHPNVVTFWGTTAHFPRGQGEAGAARSSMRLKSDGMPRVPWDSSEQSLSSLWYLFVHGDDGRFTRNPGVRAL
eukprot:767681-Hanusia_phi.AAC.2